MNSKTLSYRDAGVDIDAGNQLVDKIKPLAKKTRRPEVLASIGGFGALFEMPAGYQQPVLVSGTDGVGTKLKLAFDYDRHDTIGIDLVAMSVNDILVQGAEPLFFLDYFACGQLDVDVAARVVAGIAEGCLQSGCALIGGETAEMPGMYTAGEYDLAGFAVGVVEKSKIITGHDIRPGQAVIGLASSGPHSNGYSLIRRVLADQGIDHTIDNKPLLDCLMAPTRIYVKSIQKLMKTVTVYGLAHITGGGFIDNLPRILPDNMGIEILPEAQQLPPLFAWLAEKGNIAKKEMFRTFNCGIGMALIVDESDVANAIDILNAAGEDARVIGKVVSVSADQEPVLFL